MLVLSRRDNQKIFIGDDITITLVEVKGGRVRIGIDAPREVLIRRAELLDQWRSLPAPTPVGPSAARLPNPPLDVPLN